MRRPANSAGVEGPAAWTLPEGAVHLWRFDLVPDWLEHPCFPATLSPDEERRAAAFRQDVHRRRYRVGRGCLRMLLGRYLGCSPEEIWFEYGEQGKPSLAPASRRLDLRFNLSHCDDVALAGFAVGREIGVDVERIHQDVSREKIAERFFSPLEVAAFLAAPPEVRPRAFFQCWTRKEAYLKAHGGGLSLPLSSFDVRFLPGEPAELLATRAEPNGVERWEMHAPELEEELVAAVVVERPLERISVSRMLPSGAPAGVASHAPDPASGKITG